jgi:hypothetical protein
MHDSHCFTTADGKYRFIGFDFEPGSDYHRCYETLVDDFGEYYWSPIDVTDELVAKLVREAKDLERKLKIARKKTSDD